MTQNQNNDLQNWKKDQSQPLPESLKNALIERCLEELKNNKEARNKFNFLNKFVDPYTTKYGIECIFDKPNTLTEEVCFKFCFYNSGDEYTATYYNLFTGLYTGGITEQCGQLIIQTLLSRTPDGQAVMSFLDVDSNRYNMVDNFYGDTVADYYDGILTLDHLLHREFTEALRVGKTFNEALKIINLIYLQYV